MFITLPLPIKPSIREYPLVVVVTEVEPHFGHFNVVVAVFLTFDAEKRGTDANADS